MTQARFVQEGQAFDHTPVSAVAAGAVVVQNSLIGVAKQPIEANRPGALAAKGVFDVVKATGAINAGAAVYWDADGNPVGGTAGTGAATTTSGGNSFMGFAVAAAAESDATVRVLLVPITQVTNTIHQDLTNVIADPNNGGAIPVTDSGSVQIVTTGAQTRTLAAPSNVGQMLSISMKTDGGDCVITVADPHIDGTNNTITLNDVGDRVLLVGGISGAGFVWRLGFNVGATLSHV